MHSSKRNRLIALAVSSAVALFASRASAVITFGGTGSNTGAAPGNANNYEGIFNNSFTGTPISSNMLITASHIYPGGTTTFVYNNGTATATTYNIQIVASLDDLAIWKIAPNQTANFSLFAPTYTGSNELNSTIVDLGRGLSRGAPIVGGWSWTGGANPLSWGTNTISAVPTNTQLNLSSTLGGDFLQFDFNNQDPSSPTYNPNEATLAPGDSGGGAFINVNGQYQLAGVNSFVSNITDANGNAVQGSLYDTFGYYGINPLTDSTLITTHTPESSYVTRVSSKQNFIGITDGAISAAAAPQHVINNDGLFTAYSNMTIGAVIGDGSLQVGAAGVSPVSVQIAPNSGTSKIAGLAVYNGSTLDITNNRVIIDGGQNTMTENWLIKRLASGYNNGTWTGTGIVSSVAAANPTLFGVGMADAGNPNVTGLTSGEVELQYALNGDANLDGKVNASDFAIVAAFYNQNAPLGWEDGDFNYSGSVNGSDFGLLMANFGKGVVASTVVNVPADMTAVIDFMNANGLSSSDSTSDSVSLPEPTALTAVAFGSALAFTRPRRRKLAI